MAPTKEQVAQAVLDAVAANGAIKDTTGFTVAGEAIAQPVILGALNSLKMKEMVDYTTLAHDVLTLTDEGEAMRAEGSYEYRFWAALPAAGDAPMPPAQAAQVLGKMSGLGQAQAMKRKWVTKTADGWVRAAEAVQDATREALAPASGPLAAPSAAVLKELKSRKLTKLTKITSYAVTKGPCFTTEMKEELGEITAELIASGEWETAPLKKYNFAAEGVLPASGYLHPLLKVREEFRQIFFELGFTEMPTNRYVESSFWNFDALFQPQQHPARDAHDTFFLKQPQNADLSVVDPALIERVAHVHSHGAYGSLGYGYDWSKQEAEKLILRTHTTAVSSRMLYELAQQKPFKPTKLFSIDRVFRNETVDATHLAEFSQIEGLVAERGLTLGHLIGIIHDFFKKLGIEKLRFKPAYNPYTEPSMEIFSWHEGLGKYVEIGNSGCFRPEMLRSLGLPEDVSVIAWGLSLERPTMIKYGINNIRDLVGHRVDLNMIRRNALPRFD
ncbi:hypothetical protein CXG81DRAFT_9706 [Caulochytrium protostelioides]|uniref:Probable phenylalanine--tRNA ligase alpha subunit n=1 Tax=Caulochytrium protostelioides TaxID=1555241 RepID=A0A4P9XCU4_9FUNG|nr:hypothetical protein CXG81DRAFT_9706 [Caulochytrium protostelioides]|eukprot:RKP03287.1 hypothetical protein CXG81DRAFT_9706 [Caulochytrium protostelioides]